MVYIVIFISKILSFIGRLLNRGSSLPGYVARKLDHNILSKLDLSDHVVIVTGTNGKTSTTKYIAQALSDHGYRVTSNASGANMPQGITTEILKNVGMNAKLKSDYLVLEVDEAYVKEINQAIKAKYLVVTNLFKDQVDRFPDINKVKEIIIDGIVSENTLILNADDPFSRDIANTVSNPVIYFGYDNIIDAVQDEKIKCPQCQKELSYRAVTYDHLGDYSCICGFKRPDKVNYSVNAYDSKKHQIIINGVTYTLNNPALYNTYNYLASCAMLFELGLSAEQINTSLSKAVVGLGRMETFKNGEQTCFVNLVKNEVGINQSLSYISLLDERKYNLFLSVHSRVPDGPNIEWLNAVDVEEIKKPEVKEFIVTGDEALRVKELFIKNGISESHIKAFEILDEAVEYVLSDKQNPAYFLANYTSLPDVRKKIFS